MMLFEKIISKIDGAGFSFGTRGKKVVSFVVGGVVFVFLVVIFGLSQFFISAYKGAKGK